VNPAEIVSPGAITVANSTNDYNFSGSSIGGAASLTKSGSMMLTLSSANSYSGGTVLNAGTLKLSHVAALGAVGQTLTLNGGTLALGVDSPANSYNVTLYGSSTVLLDRATSGAAITNTFGFLSFSNSSTLSVSGGTNVSSGTATLVFSGVPQFGIPVGITTTFEIGTNTMVSLAGSLNGAPGSTATVVKTGSGTLTISGVNNYWDAPNGNPFGLRQGTLDLRNANAFGDNGGHLYPVVASSNTTLRLTVDSNTTFLGVGTCVITGDNVTVVSDRITPGAGVTHTTGGGLTLTNNYTLNAVAGANVTNGNAGINFGATSLGGNATINVINPASGGGTMIMAISGLVSQVGSGRSLTKTGNGTLSLTPTTPNNYSGGTVVNGGILQLNYGNPGTNMGTIAGLLTINTGAAVRATAEKALGFATSPSGNVTVITINGGLLEHAGPNGLNGGQTVFMTAGEIRSNGGVPSPSSASFRIAGGPDPTIYVQASSATSLISGRVAMDTTGNFNVQDGAADIDLLITATMTDGIGTGTPPNGIIKTNSGTMALNSSNTFSRGAQIVGGRLLVNNGTGSGTGTGAVTVAFGTTLGGTGAISGPVTSSGTIAPGAPSAPVARLAMANQYTQTVTGTLSIEISGSQQYDVLAVGGSAALNGTLAVATNGYAPVPGDVFTVLTTSARSGVFAVTNLPTLSSPSMLWNVDYQSAAVVLSVTSVPPTGYDAYALQITNALLRAAQADADGDGFANLLEYVTGDNPNNPVNTNSLMSAGRTNSALSLIFFHDITTTDATLYVEGSYNSTNDATWATVNINSNGVWSSPATVTENPIAPPLYQANVQDTDPAATNRFLRLRVTRP
jgi:autotransporter-associated beta strand protein